MVFRLAVPGDEPLARACPACGREIAAGWVPALSPAGRCPACRARVGPPPLAVELVTAALFGLLAAWVRPGLVLAAACWLAACAVALALIDAAVQRLPDVLTAPAYAGTVVLLALAAAVGGDRGELVRAVVGGLALAAAYLVSRWSAGPRLGLGDAKLAGSLSPCWPAPGGEMPTAGTVACFSIGGFFGTGLLLPRRATRRKRILFGLFMITGGVLADLVTAAGADQPGSWPPSASWSDRHGRPWSRRVSTRLLHP